MTVHGSFKTWRNLADLCKPNIPHSAAAPRPTATAPCGRSSGLGPQDMGDLRWLGRATGQDRGGDKQRKAADRRVKGQGNPGRNRKGEGPAHYHQPNRCRQENQTCKHVLQPPREEHDQRASSAWQDCGYAWENLRLSVRTQQRYAALESGRNRNSTARNSVPNILQSWVEFRTESRLRSGKMLKRKCFFGGHLFAAAPPSRGPALAWPRADGRVTIWHKVRSSDRGRKPIATDDCLSFVMAEQQSARGAVCEDGN